MLTGEQVLPALIDSLRAFLVDGGSAEIGANAPLFTLITGAAEMLDADLALVRADDAGAKTMTGKKRRNTEDMEANENSEPEVTSLLTVTPPRWTGAVAR